MCGLVQLCINPKHYNHNEYLLEDRVQKRVKKICCMQGRCSSSLTRLAVFRCGS